MSERHYKQGIDRQQGHLLPPSLEEYVAANNPVRVVDVYVDSLDMVGYKFKNAAATGVAPGQPAYAPRALLKLFLYGYLHGIRSSRKLEAECQRNLEVLWLMEGLKPSYKTIADFRKANTVALTAICKDFVSLCKEMDLFGKELVSIDGSYFRGNVGKKSIYTETYLRERLQRIEQHIADYLSQIEQADQEEAPAPELTKAQLNEKLEQLQVRQKQHQERLRQIAANGATQLAEVDPDARVLAKNGQAVAGYNVQMTVDGKHKLIADFAVTQDGNDKGQLEPMARRAQAVLGAETLEVVADTGYYNVQAIVDCVSRNITPYVPKPRDTSRAGTENRFVRDEFSYDPEQNCFVCPAKKLLRYASTQKDKGGKVIYQYQSSPEVCSQCALKARCLPKKMNYRTVTRWEYDGLLKIHDQRMAKLGKAKMTERACLAEHPFGTLKLTCGWNHFLVRGLEKVCAEMSLLVLTYNFKRIFKIDGALEKFRQLCQERATKLQLGY